MSANAIDNKRTQAVVTMEARRRGGVLLNYGIQVPHQTSPGAFFSFLYHAGTCLGKAQNQGHEGDGKRVGKAGGI